MITKIILLGSAKCSEYNFSMLHSVIYLTACYIADSISPQQKLIISNLNQKESLMRIESQVSEKSLQRVKTSRQSQS